MEYITLSSGYKLPMVGLGTFFGMPNTLDFTDDEVYEAVKKALDAGYRHIDTAWLYHTEAAVGKAIREKMGDGAVTREELFITTKLSFAHHNLVRKGVLESLTNLGLSYLDLFLIHCPMAIKMPADGVLLALENYQLDDESDLLRTWRELEQLVNEGLIRSIGVSNFNSKQVRNILKNCAIKPAVNQVEAHIYMSNEALVQFCQDNGVAVTAYTPLGLAHTHWRPRDFPIALEDPVVVQIAKTHDKTPAQVALRYQTQRGLSVIAKSSNPERIKENIQILNFTLNEEEMNSIKALNRNLRSGLFKALVGHKDYFLNEPF